MSVFLRTYRLLLLSVLFLLLSSGVMAQVQEHSLLNVSDTVKTDMLMVSPMEADKVYGDITIKNPAIPADSALLHSTNSGKPKLWKPDVERATWLALVIPGGGQIYNRKYWKLPIVYGGFVGCMYAYNWNGQMYKDYRQAYLDIMDSDPNTDSFKDFFRPGYDFERNKEYLKNVFKKRKDKYRRWRDMSIFAFVGVYALSVIDAYVDAQLSSFDISEDINLTVEPQVINDGKMLNDKGYYGFNCNITF